MLRLLLATRNPNKTREFRELLGKDFEVIDLNSFAEIAIPEESGRTFAENAVLKAVTASQLRHASRAEDRHVQLRHASRAEERYLLVAADDSGLEVDSLGGGPGIYSARYAGENATDKESIDKLLRELKQKQSWRNFPSCDVSKRQVGNLPHLSKARFRCVIALARDGQLLKTFEGVVEGTIVDPPRGGDGFGYDPVFQPNGFDQTFAELPTETKNTISHRAAAARQLRDFLYADRVTIAHRSA